MNATEATLGVVRGDYRYGGASAVPDEAGFGDREHGEALEFMDLGNAVLSAEMVIEMLSSDLRERVQLVDAPFVEGAFAAEVVASTGADAGECVEAAMKARTESKLHSEE